ncbi:MAG TPA: hypothetical protein VLF93_02810 [Candidatus Saccharimonadales bacterium]|nr:hypothetical protein [Candidatus Saccharimonadales bacterium]
MPVQRKKKKLTAKKIQRGAVGNFFVFGVLALLIVAAITAVGGLPPDKFSNSGTLVNIVTPTQAPNHNTLQLQTFGYTTIAPTPTPPPEEGLCKEGGDNDEPWIIAGYSPSLGQTVGATGQIKVWVNDELVPFIAPGQQVNNSTGAVVANTGNLTAKAPDNYLWEPSLYIAPHTEESGGSPHFPDFIKGTYNNNPPSSTTQGTQGATADPIPNGTVPTQPQGSFGSFFGNFTSEYIWNVSELGLSTGTYQAEFVIHDGDVNLGVGCVSIQIQ